MSTKLVMISGGSRGLGLHMAEHLLAAGHNIGTFARKRTPQADALCQQHPDRFHFIECDASDTKKLGRYMNELVDQHGSLHGLINNAAVGQDHLLVHASPEKIHSIISTNLEAPILLTRLALKQMLLQEGGGRVVNISSICGLRGYTGLTVYSSTKAGMDAFTRCLAHEVSGRGILINSIAPGFFESEMSSVLSADQLSTIKRRTPTHHMTAEHNIMPVLDMLLFADINMTGQTIVVDGGTSC